MKYESVTITIENTKSIVEIAMIFGFIPCFTAPKIAVGKVSTPAPLTKFVMMKSSSEIMKANKNPDMIPGIIRGSRILVNACLLVA